jgi:hypothetical protein
MRGVEDNADLGCGGGKEGSTFNEDFRSEAELG